MNSNNMPIVDEAKNNFPKIWQNLAYLYNFDTKSYSKYMKFGGDGKLDKKAYLSSSLDDFVMNAYNTYGHSSGYITRRLLEWLKLELYLLNVSAAFIEFLQSKKFGDFGISEYGPKYATGYFFVYDKVPTVSFVLWDKNEGNYIRITLSITVFDKFNDLVASRTYSSDAKMNEYSILKLVAKNTNRHRQKTVNIPVKDLNLSLITGLVHDLND